MDSAPGTPPVVAARHSASDGLFRTAHARRVRVPCRRVPGQIGMGFSVSNGDLPSRGEECNPLTGLRPARDRPVRAQTRQARTLVWDHSGTDRNPRIRVQRPIRSGRCYAGSGATPVPAEPGATDTIPPRRGFRGAMEFRSVGTRTRAVSSASRPNGCPGTRRDRGTLGAFGGSRCVDRLAALIAFRKRWMERVRGIEPLYPAWEADILPLNYTRPVGKRVPQGSGRRQPRLAMSDRRETCRFSARPASLSDFTRCPLTVGVRVRS